MFASSVVLCLTALRQLVIFINMLTTLSVCIPKGPNTKYLTKGNLQLKKTEIVWFLTKGGVEWCVSGSKRKSEATTNCEALTVPLPPFQENSRLNKSNKSALEPSQLSQPRFSLRGFY